MADNGKVNGTKGPQSKSWRSFFHVDKRLLLLKAHFFFFNGALAGGFTPLILLIMQLGVPIATVGILYAVLPFVQFITKPFPGAIADKFQIPKTVFVVSLIAMTISIFSVNFIPKPAYEAPPEAVSWALEDVQLYFDVDHQENKTVAICDSNGTEISADALTVLCSISCRLPDLGPEICSFYGTDVGLDLQVSSERYRQPSPVSYGTNGTDNCHRFRTAQYLQEYITSQIPGCPTPDNLTLYCTGQCHTDVSPDINPVAQHSIPMLHLIWLWSACIVGWVAKGSAYTTGEVILVTALGDDKTAYGRTRFFGSLGWGVMSVVAAQLIDWQSSGLPRKDYSAGFYVFFVLMALDLLTVLCVSVSVSPKPKSLTKDVGHLFRKPEFCVFALGVFNIGIVTAIFMTYMVVYANELNGTQVIIGLNYFVEGFISEIPFFLIAGWMVTRFGHPYVLSFVVIASGLKSLCYSFVSNAWYILIIALMHGTNFATMSVTVATYSSIVAPPGGDVTVQGIFHGLFEGAGWGIGNLVGALAYDKLGGQMTFRLTGIVFMAVGFAHLGINICLKKSKTASVTVHPANIQTAC